MKESIVKNIFKIVSSFSLVLLLAACGSIDIIDDDENEVESEKLSTVSVKARAASEEENAYPIRVYTFAENGNLKSNNLIKSAQETVSLRLPSSVLSYVVAVSANEDVFSFSAAPSISSPITAKSPKVADEVVDNVRNMAKGYVASNPLQMAVASITPTGKSGTLDMRMAYMMASLNFTLEGLPDECTYAYVSVSTPFEGVTFAGENMGSKQAVVPLVLDRDKGIWKSGEVYVFPTSGNQTLFTIAYNDAEGEKFAQVSLASALKVGTPYVLNGSLQDGVVNVTGSVSPAKWGSAVSLAFKFSEKGTTYIDVSGNVSEKPDENYVQEVEEFPKALTLWKNHLVLNVSPLYNGTARVWLLSRGECENVRSAYSSMPDMASTLAKSYSEDDIVEWRIPNSEEASLIRKLYLSSAETMDNLMVSAGGSPLMTVDEKGNNVRYLCSDATETYSLKSGASYNGIKEAGASVTNYHLRLVSEVLMKLKNSSK